MENMFQLALKEWIELAEIITGLEFCEMLKYMNI